MAIKTPPETRPERVVMGRVAAPYAVQGWLKIQPYTECLDGLLDYREWWLGSDQGPHPGWRAYRVLDGRVHGQTLLVQLAEVADRSAADRLKGLLVAVERAALPPAEADAYYWDDLIGLEVVNLQHVRLGKVAGLLETGAHDVLRVQGERERLIPFVAAYVREVDLQAGCLRVDWGADWDLG